MVSAGFLIYSGIMPLVKMFISILCGFVLARKGLFPPAAARGASQVTMNLSLPCLIFANIVPAFTPDNVSALGPLFLLAFTYQAIGFVFGLFIREVCYVPRNFWQGILILCGMSNWGNLPNAIVMTVTQQAPFDPAKDPALGVSFVSIFIVAYHTVFWVFGAAQSLSWDYQPDVPQGPEAEVHVGWKEKPIGGWFARRYLAYAPPQRPGWGRPESYTGNVIRSNSSSTPDTNKTPSDTIPNTPMDPEKSATSSGSSAAPEKSMLEGTTPGVSKAPSIPPVSSTSSARKQGLLSRILHRLHAAITPITCSLVISITIALVPDLKALFLVSSKRTWRAPDNRAPLAAFLDTTSFLGGITVPLALIILGASFARLRIPRPFMRLPIKAMFAAALGKMIILPAIGVVLTHAMTTGGLVPREAIAERFVMMLLGGTPAAVNQLIVAGLYSPTGEVDTLSAFLLVQYTMMFLTSSALTAIALLLL